MEWNEQPYLYARLTQLGECLPYKEKVGGSSPSSSTTHVWRWRWTLAKFNLQSRLVAHAKPSSIYAGESSSLPKWKYAKLTEAALGLVLKTMGTVMNRMGGSTPQFGAKSWQRRLTYHIIGNTNSSYYWLTRRLHAHFSNSANLTFVYSKASTNHWTQKVEEIIS